MDRLIGYRRQLQNKIRRALPAEKEKLREEKRSVTEQVIELRRRLKYAAAIEKRSAHIDSCLDQIHDTLENQRAGQRNHLFMPCLLYTSCEHTEQVTPVFSEMGVDRVFRASNFLAERHLFGNTHKWRNVLSRRQGRVHLIRIYHRSVLVSLQYG